MKKLKLASLFAMLLIVLASVSCKQELDPMPVDTNAPANVTNLVAEAKDTRVLLTWTDATDNDIFGYEVSYSGTNTNNRAISAMEKNTLFVAQGAGGTYISGLANGTEYTFTVKTMDTSGNKSKGITASATPVAIGASETLKIALSATVPTSNAYTTSYTGNKSNTTVTVTANITTASTVKKVVYKKDGSLIAKTLLADKDAQEATKVDSDDKKWTFEIRATNETANGTYTVAAIDEAGREEAEQIKINHFDFTAPAIVKITNGVYSKDLSCIILDWTEPSDEDFDHVKITYTSNDGTSNSKESEAITVPKGTANKTFTNIDGSKAYYTYYFVSVDALGNKSATREYKVSVKSAVKNIPDGFVEVTGKSFNGTETWKPESKVFVSGRSITIRNLIVCDHEVTQKEYETYCQYGSSSPRNTSGKGDNFPAYFVSLYDAIVYCNLRSIEENLDPVYKMDGVADPKKWSDIQGNETEKYCASTNADEQWGKITMDIEADGYRLPTEAEWEYLARGGETTSTEYSGSDTIDDVAWYKVNSVEKTHEVRTKKPNNLGLYDMSGNVWEWCWDRFLPSKDIKSSTPETIESSSSWAYRCLRGGGWGHDDSSYCSVSSRGSSELPSSRYLNYDYGIGFRVVRTAN